jgi:hypothetical protein
LSVLKAVLCFRRLGHVGFWGQAVSILGRDEGKRALDESRQNGALRYTADAARKTGTSERTIRREVARGATPHVPQSRRHRARYSGRARRSCEALETVAEAIDRTGESQLEGHAKTALKQIKREEGGAELAERTATASKAIGRRRTDVIDKDFSSAGGLLNCVALR